MYSDSGGPTGCQLEPSSIRGRIIRCWEFLVLHNLRKAYTLTIHLTDVGDIIVDLALQSVMDVDFRENLPNGESMSRGGQLLSELEAEPSTDEGALGPTLGLEA